MKKLIALLALGAITATSASALTREQAREFCPAIESLARTIMTARQSGTSMSTVMAVLGNVELAEDGGVSRRITDFLIISAYDEPHWHTDSSRQDAINRFSIEAGVECWGTVE